MGSPINPDFKPLHKYPQKPQSQQAAEAQISINFMSDEDAEAIFEQAKQDKQQSFIQMLYKYLEAYQVKYTPKTFLLCTVALGEMQATPATVHILAVTLKNDMMLNDIEVIDDFRFVSLFANGYPDKHTCVEAWDDFKEVASAIESAAA